MFYVASTGHNPNYQHWPHIKCHLSSKGCWWVSSCFSSAVSVATVAQGVCVELRVVDLTSYFAQQVLSSVCLQFVPSKFGKLTDIHVTHIDCVLVSG